MKRMYLILGLATLALISCNEVNSSEKKSPLEPKQIKVETVKVKSVKNTEPMSYNGLITPSKEVFLNFQFLGTITSIYVDEGDFVRKGQMLAEIDKGSLESALQASVAMQKQAQDAYGRLEKVHQKGSLPDIKWEEMKSKLEQANAAVESSKQNLDKTFLKAPSSGVIGSRNIEIGSSINLATSAFSLVTINNVYVKISVPENEINRIKKGLVAQVKVGAVGNTLHTATVEKIGVLANRISKTYEVKLLMDNPDFIIKPGMVCNVTIEMDSNNSKVSIPIQSVMGATDNDKYVFVVDPNSSKAVKRSVKLGKLVRNGVEVNSGLSQNELVIASGQHKLKGQEIVEF